MSEEKIKEINLFLCIYCLSWEGELADYQDGQHDLEGGAGPRKTKY